MKILLYEWCCSGGLSGPDAAELIPDSAAIAERESIAREGWLMLEALAKDAARDSGLDVTVLLDASRSISMPAGVRMQEVPPGAEIEALLAASQQADWTIIVAPETAGILQTRVAEVRAAGGRVLAPGDGFIAITGDKQATVNVLAGGGVPVPAGRSLAAGEAVPHAFHMPAVRKARASVGCDDLVVLHSAAATSSRRATRLEEFVPGTPVGVSCVCGPTGVHALPPMVQQFSDGNRPRYLHSRPLPDRAQAARAGALAVRAVATIERAAGGTTALGWVGVDMILGPRHDGRNDRVLEVNPRLTTSFVEHAGVAPASLVRSLIDAAHPPF